MAEGTRRGRRADPAKVDALVREGLEKAREVLGNPVEFNASFSTISDGMSGRSKPSIPTIKKSLERLQGEGLVTVADWGGRGQAMLFRWGKSNGSKPRVATAAKASATLDTTPDAGSITVEMIRELRQHKVELQGQIATLYKSLAEETEALEAELQALTAD